MPRSGCLLAAMVSLLLSCTASPAGYDYHSGPDGSGGADRRALEDLNAPEPDGRSPWDTVPEDGPGGPDVSTDLTADGSSPEDLGTADAADTGKDTEAPPPCGDVEFTYSGPVEAEALVTGSFTGWAESAAAGALVMADPDGDGVWRVTTHLESGTYPYKLIVDGAWMTDPSNPVTADDGNGNVNSILVVDCPEPGSLVLQAHETIDDAFHAEFMVAGGAVAPGEVTVTVDYAAAPAGAVGVEEGGTILTVDLDGLATGIHDVRVTGPTGETLLLKVYVGVSTDWRDATLYFVMTDRFRNGDPGNDGPIPGCDSRTNYQGGDFAGVTNALEEGYFDELGVGALWLSWPVDNPETAEEGGRPSAHTCNMNPKTAQYTPVQFSGYHGYWPKDLYKVEERFGTMEELRELVTAAHARGIRVLLDFTANHVHTSSPFYQEHQGDGFFHFPVEICQDVGWDVKPVTCWFTEHLADLNYGNPATVEAVLDYAMFWAKETGSDGFRLDAVKHIEMGFIEALRARAKAEMELTGVDFYIVGETFTGDAGLINSFLGADRIHGQFDFPANYQILRGFATREVGLDAMDQAVRQAKGMYWSGALMSNFLGNHDISRFTSLAAGDMWCGIWDVVSDIAQGWLGPPTAPTEGEPYQFLGLAFAYLMTIPGLPLIYYGDEYGMPGAGDPDNRRMMQFGDALTPLQAGALADLRLLGQARAAHPALRTGEWSGLLWQEGDFIAYARTLPDEKALILLNRGAAAKSGQLGVAAAGIPDGTTLTDALNGGTATVTGGSLSFTCPARAAAIYITE